MLDGHKLLLRVIVLLARDVRLLLFHTLSSLALPTICLLHLLLLCCRWRLVLFSIILLRITQFAVRQGTKLMNKLRLVACGTLSCFLCSLFDEVFVLTRPTQCSVETVAGLLLVALRTGFHLLCHLVLLIRMKAYAADDLSGEEAGKFSSFCIAGILCRLSASISSESPCPNTAYTISKEVTERLCDAAIRTLFRF